MPFPRFFVSFGFVAFVGSLASAADVRSQEEIADVRPSPLPPVLVCPPRYSTPLVVPADELLRQAEQLQPVTPEGWIVRNRPVSECVHCIDDPATRSHELFEYPMKLRHYDTQIRLARAEVASWQRRLESYEYFNKAGAFNLAVENAQLAYQEALERWRNLRHERMLFLRLRNLEKEWQQGVFVGESVR